MEEWKEDLPEEKKIKSFQRVIELCHGNIYSNNHSVRKYLYERGITDETIRKFKLGAFPDSAQSMIGLLGRSVAYKIGVVKFEERDGYEYKVPVSKFTTHKLIIPIYNEHGEPIALMGRCIMSEKEREEMRLEKYNNTFYKKGSSLYGLSTNKECIRESGLAYVVEGNFDVIMAYQNGMRNVVAASGSWLTKNQVLSIARYTPNIKLLFDNDEAGQKAISSSMQKYRDIKGLSVSRGNLPEGIHDLDDFFRKRKKLGKKLA